MVGGGYTMALQSALFRGDVKLEACLVHDSAHVKTGAVGEHVTKVQVALATLDGVAIAGDELSRLAYRPFHRDRSAGL